MIKNTFTLLTITILCSFSAWSQSEIARITVNAGNSDRTNIIVQATLTGLNLHVADSTLELTEINKNRETAIAAELVIDGEQTLIWRISGTMPAGTVKKYRLSTLSGQASDALNPLSIDRLGNNLTVKYGDKNVLQYNFDAAALPEGASPIFRRGGFLHPLWSPKGEVLTRIQPPDHYHHMGIWNPWTHSEYNGRVIDFWNLIKAEGTVRPVTITSVTENPFFAGFKVIHDHVDLNGQTAEGFQVILKEV